MATGLSGWPEHRREILLWRFALTLDYDGVEDYVRASSADPCSWRWHRQHTGEMVAVLGDDGRYHLFRDDVVLCTEIYHLGRAVNVDHHDGHVPHRRHCDWWTDGTRYRMFAPRTAPPEQQRAPRASHCVEWVVRLLDDRVDPSAVPPLRRCTYVGGRSDWPPHLTIDTRMGRIRQTLINLKGSQCHACGLRTGVIVDHDHFTGLVRGLLCSHCNAWIDQCPHLNGCPWAAYLNNPPAAQLRLRHPGAHNDRKLNQARIEYLGIDPFPATTRH